MPPAELAATVVALPARIPALSGEVAILDRELRSPFDWRASEKQRLASIPTPV
jgi:hypothetical protein